MKRIIFRSDFQISSSAAKLDESNGYFLKIRKLISQANKVILQNKKNEPESFFQFPSFEEDGVAGVASTVPYPTNVKFLKQFAQTQKRKRNYNQLPLESYLFEEERLKILQNQQQQQQQGNIRQLEEDRAMEYENILSSSERQSQYEHELHKMGVPVIAGIGPGGPHPPSERLVHLDLKGAAPKVCLLYKFFRISTDWK